MASLQSLRLPTVALVKLSRVAGYKTIDYYEKEFSQQEEANNLLKVRLAEVKAELKAERATREKREIFVDKRLDEPLRDKSSAGMQQTIKDMAKRMELQGIELRRREDAIRELSDQVRSMGGSVIRWARFRSDSRPVMRR